MFHTWSWTNVIISLATGTGVHGAGPSARAFGAAGIRTGQQDRGLSDYWKDPTLLVALRRMAAR